MDKKYTLIIITALVFILLSASLFFVFQNKTNTNTESPIATSTNITNPKDKKDEVDLSVYSNDYKKVFQAVFEKNEEYCDHLEETSKDSCFYDIGSVNSDASFCYMITDEGLKRDCLEIVSVNDAINKNEVSRCKNINKTEFKDYCFKEIFRKQNTASFCDAIDENYRSICQDIVYTNTLFTNTNSSLCDKITDPFLRENCKISSENALKDSDGDGVLDVNEISFGTDPFSADDYKNNPTNTKR